MKVNPQFGLIYGRHNGAHPQNYLAWEAGASFRLFSDLNNLYRVGFGYGDGSIQKDSLSENVYRGYRLHQFSYTIGYERKLNDYWKLCLYESLQQYFYASGLCSKDSDALVNPETDKNHYSLKTSAGAMFRYIGILASVETNLSVGLGMQFQIGW
jgi:hypothetical protein